MTTANAARRRTVVTDSAWAAAAGLAAREVPGVAGLGGGDGLRAHLPVSTATPVRVEAGQRQLAVDVDIVARYGVPLPGLAAAVRSHVVAMLEHMSGSEVTDVALTVSALQVEEDDA